MMRTDSESWCERCDERDEITNMDNKAKNSRKHSERRTYGPESAGRGDIGNGYIASLRNDCRKEWEMVLVLASCSNFSTVRKSW